MNSEGALSSEEALAIIKSSMSGELEIPAHKAIEQTALKQQQELVAQQEEQEQSQQGPMHQMPDGSMMPGETHGEAPPPALGKLVPTYTKTGDLVNSGDSLTQGFSNAIGTQRGNIIGQQGEYAHGGEHEAPELDDIDSITYEDGGISPQNQKTESAKIARNYVNVKGQLYPNAVDEDGLIEDKSKFPDDKAFSMYKEAVLETEGERLTGYLPNNKFSGVTVGRGFDIGQFSTRQIKTMFSDDKVLMHKLLPYANKKKPELDKSNINGKKLKISSSESEKINETLFNQQWSSIKSYTNGKGATEDNVKTLMQLKHWSGALGNTSGNLAPKGENHIWKEIQDGDFDTQELYNAVMFTREDLGEKTKENEWKYNTLKKHHTNLGKQMKEVHGENWESGLAVTPPHPGEFLMNMYKMQLKNGVLDRRIEHKYKRWLHEDWDKDGDGIPFSIDKNDHQHFERKFAEGGVRKYHNGGEGPGHPHEEEEIKPDGYTTTKKYNSGRVTTHSTFNDESKRSQGSGYVSAIPTDSENYILNAGMLPEVNIKEKDPRSWVKRNYQKYIAPIGHGVLDVVGMIPAAGELADGINALWYTAEGNYEDAALSSAAMIPFAGWAATAGKWGKNTIRAMDKVTPGGGGMYQQLRYLQDVNPKLAGELGIKNKKQIKKMLKNDPAAAQKIIDDANAGKVFDGGKKTKYVEPTVDDFGKKVNTDDLRSTGDDIIDNRLLDTQIDPDLTFRKSAFDRTHPNRGGHTFSDIAGEYTWLDNASKIDNHVIAPFNPKFNKAGDMTSFDLQKLDDYVPFSSHKMEFPNLNNTGFKNDLTHTMKNLQNNGFHHMDMHGGNILVKSDNFGKILDYKIIDPVGYTHDFQKSEMFLRNNPEFQDWDGILKNRSRVNDDIFRIQNEMKHGGLRRKRK